VPVRILDCTQLENKPGGNGRSWSGCIPHCTKLAMCKSTDPFDDPIDLSGKVLAHEEDGKDGDGSTYAGRMLIRDRNEAIARRVHARKSDTEVLWYCPKPARDIFFAASLKDPAATAKVEEWVRYQRSLVASGLPGKGLGGVLVDLYDFESIMSVWESRAKAAFAVWNAAGIRAVPILLLRFKDTGACYSQKLARERIAFASKLSKSGEVAVFDIKHDETPDDFNLWPFAALMQSIAKGT
jgi:hypothetical protein